MVINFFTLQLADLFLLRLAILLLQLFLTASEQVHQLPVLLLRSLLSF